ncbi:unnamed protein product [Lasius platythorax]
MVRALSEPQSRELTDIIDEFHSVIKEKSWWHIRCYNHTLQLAISDTRKDMGVSTVIEKVSSIVARYNRSRPARESFQSFQSEHKLPKHELLQMVETRWDSEFIMLQRFVEQKAAIISEQGKTGIDSLTVQEWKLIEGYVEILRPVAIFTADMESNTKPTLSTVLPVLFEIQSSLEEFVKKAPKGTGIMFARKLLANIKSRFPNCNYKESELYQLAMSLDPRFKDVLCGTVTDAVSLLQRKTLDKRRQHISRGFVEISATKVNTSSSVEQLNNSNNDKWSYFNKKVKSNTIIEKDEYELIKKQVDDYLSQPTIGGNEDPLAWWKANQNIFPLLAPLARHFLGLAAKETACERVFSVGGNIVTPKRTTILPEHVKEIVFCHDNLEFP